MAPNLFFSILLPLFFLAASSMAALVQQSPLLKYHNGTLLRGTVTVNLIWYGKFTAVQRSIIVDFLHSLNSPKLAAPSAASWWRTTEKYGGGASKVVVGKQFLDENCSLGKSLKHSNIVYLAARGGHSAGVINAVLTANDVAVNGFCMSRCGTHGSARGAARFAYAWVGDSETQCPGYCAWPFHQPAYGPQAPPLVAPNGDVGADGMVINLAAVLAGAVTNPFNNGYFQGPVTAPLEAVTACTGVFGSGAYPGYAGTVLTDKSSGGSYNAHGVNGRRYLLPAMWDPQTSQCATLV
ncbi:protein EXORDIUM-like 2 [Andrographis paniculata]|uniref:protein EXORDIUM-like 2 n=1 Tax=Andrographis paniculata TaxID=175694 RepID=UPI0021E7647A|nr:protein EXORDIUM-like 2 [Andrographis paniculata]